MLTSTYSARTGRLLGLGCSAILLVGLVRPQAASGDEPVDFARDIRPILSDRCFVCHGPDTAQRATELRLDERDSAVEYAISVEQPADSELLKRIHSDDPDSLMPPPDSKLRLSDDEKRLLAEWIAAGAPYSEHWSFQPAQRPQVPALPSDLAAWPTNPIDHFVAERLVAEGLEPSMEAQPAVLLRRLCLDLTGLPPSVVEVQEFEQQLAAVADAADPRAARLAAYEQWVDRWLASPKFGERMAVDWLDVARYADTYGYQADRYRATWPWRDWVINAFNDNLPYDQFITWQVAGDLLPDATQQQRLATAFNRHHRQTNEGGSVEEEFRAEYIADRVNTFGAAFLGLTLECCRCHDHKYDPVTQEDYYRLSGFFNNIDESGLYSHFTDATPTPAMRLSNDDQEHRLRELDEQIAALEHELSEVRISDSDYASWRNGLSDVKVATANATANALVQDDDSDRTSDAAEDTADTNAADENQQQTLQALLEQRLRQGLLADYSMDELVDGKLLNRVQAETSGNTSESPQLVPGRVGQALQFSGENNATFATGGDFTRDQAFSIALWVKTNQRFPRSVIFHRSRAWTDAGSRGYELLIEEGRLSAALIHFWPGNAMRIVARDELRLNAWTHVVLSYDGSSRAEGLRLFVDGELAEVEVVRDKLQRAIHGGEAKELTLAQRFRDVGFKDGLIDELKIYNRELTELEVAMLRVQDAYPQNLAEYLHNVDDARLRPLAVEAIAADQMQAARGRLAELRKERSGLIEAIPEVMVMREMTEPRPTFLLRRGEYDALGEEVTRGVPSKFAGSLADADAPSRLELAQWLVDPRHPLTARVTVNRLWQTLFGKGIVATTEDFGLQGASPTHPELLDWLATEFVESGWNVKHLLKRMVMSSTYRQSSDLNAQLIEGDPENDLLARGPAFRMPAEMLRDSVLQVSGLLVDKMGGPPVKPYQPEGLWEEKSGESYKRDVGEGSHRRSLYTFWKRTSPPPAMMTFDASNREVCVVRRQVTSTPLQVLVLLNDPQMVEAAVALAAKSLEKPSEPVETDQPLSQSEQVDQSELLAHVFRRLCSRQPTETELQVLQQLHAEQLAWFQQRPEDARSLLTVGDYRPPEGADAVGIAALTMLAQALMNYDEFLMKR